MERWDKKWIKEIPEQTHLQTQQRNVDENTTPLKQIPNSSVNNDLRIDYLTGGRNKLISINVFPIISFLNKKLFLLNHHHIISYHFIAALCWPSLFVRCLSPPTTPPSWSPVHSCSCTQRLKPQAVMSQSLSKCISLFMARISPSGSPACRIRRHMFADDATTPSRLMSYGTSEVFA